jgi:hypothetical protein
MATYRITAPDGHTYEVTAPDKASQDDVLAYVQEQVGQKAAPAQQPPGPTPEVPGPIERLGHGFANLGAKMQQLYYMAKGDDANLKRVTDETNDANALYERGVQQGQQQATKQYGPVSDAEALMSFNPMSPNPRGIAYMLSGGGPDLLSALAENSPALVGGVGAAGVKGLVSTVPARLATGAGIGAVEGVTKFDPEGSIWSTAKQTGQGALKGALTQGAVEVGAAVLPPVVNAVAQAFLAVRNRLSGAASPQAIQTALTAELKGSGIDFNALPQPQQQAIIGDATQALKSGRQLNAQALANKADFDALGSPYTEAQLTRDPRAWTAEQRARKIEGVGDQLQNTLEAQNENLAGQLPKMRAAAGSKAGSGYEAAENARGAVQDFAKQTQQEVGQMYRAARDSAGATTEVPMQPIAQRLGQIIEDYGVENVPPAVVSRAKEFGLLNGEQTRSFTVTDAEQFRKFIGNQPGNDATARAVKASLQRSVDDAVGALGGEGAASGEAFQAARGAASQRFQALEPTPVAALNETNEAPVNFVETKILGGKPNEIAGLRDILQKQNPQAWNDIKGAVLDWLGTKAGGRGAFQGGAFADALDRIGMSRLKVLFTPEELANLGTIRRAGFNATVAPPLSAVNYSNTGSELANLFANKDTGPGLIASMVSHLPIPGANALAGLSATGREALSARALRAATSRAANPTVAALSPRLDVANAALAKLLLGWAPAVGADRQWFGP